ncbi:MAG: hypothetical protein IKY70_05715 [Bacteroidales bacterium]|nr:hypothetical protein [Bacteroidales bacterium]
MKGNICFEEISAGAISPQMPYCKAVIVNIGETKRVLAHLHELYTSQDYRVFVVNVTPSKLKATLDRCKEAGVVAIVNCGKELPQVPAWHPQLPYNGAILLPGESNSNREMLDFIAGDPFARSFSTIGYQGYRINYQTLLPLQKRYFEEMRLGAIRDNLTLAEPLVRECCHAFVDMRSVRFSDYPYSNGANPNGMYAEELCSIARYIGMSCNLKSVFIYGQDLEDNSLTVCNKLIAEVIWHICEGIVSNIYENPEKEKNSDCFENKMVSLGDEGHDISFTTSCNTGRWWMEIPSANGEIRYVPCSIDDYKTACSGEIPLRWLFFYQKYSL